MTSRTPPKGRWLRRLLFTACAAVVLLWLSSPRLISAFAGASERRAVTNPGQLSPEARTLIEDCLEGFGPGELIDYHVHLAGVGRGSDCWVNPRMLSLWHPRDYLRFRFYLSAAGVEDMEAADLAYVERLLELVEAQPLRPRILLLAFDYRYGADGQRDVEHSEFHVPNEHVWAQCQAHPEAFLPCVSIHPYRKDALVELESWAQRGVQLVKWLPNAMGIDPASELCDAYYAKMKEHGMTLLTHSGEEQAVEAEADQDLGNPLRLRRPLDAGVRVIAAHCASSGHGPDLDQPGSAALSNYQYFLRLMGEERYEGLLFGEISTVTQANRYGLALADLLRRTDLHARLVNGSDWPLPGINVLYRLDLLQADGFLTEVERELLAEVYHWNPLLFDFCLKRSVHAPGTGERFGAVVFRGRPSLGY